MREGGNNWNIFYGNYMKLIYLQIFQTKWPFEEWENTKYMNYMSFLLLNLRTIIKEITNFVLVLEPTTEIHDPLQYVKYL